MKAKRAIPPHRILLDEDVVLMHPSAWRLSYADRDSAIPNGGVVPSWEPGLDVRVRNTIRLETTAMQRLGPAASRLRLAAFAIARTSLGLHTIKTVRIPISLDGNETTVEMVLDGHDIARDLTLHLGIAVVEAPSDVDRLTPKDVGARLWGMDWRARVEGGKVRLAMDAVDFKEMFGDHRYADALVHVIVAEDPTTNVEQGLSVLLNSSQPGFIASVSRREPQATVVLWDAIIRRVIVLGAEHEYSLLDTYPEGSIGEQWKAWCKTVFPRTSVDELLEKHRTKPSEFEARIQSWARMGRAFPEEIK